ncbi:hypothetical protein B4100_1511 [Heyndrickxia coagulans]|nr:hypothetical protein B4100_1511 [Heyndrickxia coagulans]
MQKGGRPGDIFHGLKTGIFIYKGGKQIGTNNRTHIQTCDC